jgi:hypothetical protein
VTPGFECTRPLGAVMGQGLKHAECRTKEKGGPHTNPEVAEASQVELMYSDSDSVTVS